MGRRPITNPLEYMQMARRRWLWILVPSVLISGATIVGSRFLPKSYLSEALILIEAQKVPTDMVQPTVSNDVAQRLESIQEEILSRTQLSEIIQKYGLYRNQHLTADAEVTRMLGNISVQPIMDPSHRNAPVTAFRISFSADDPLLAQEVTADLSNLFINDNLKLRSQQALGTEAFITGQLQQADQTLHGLESQLKELKSKYMGALPEQQSANLTVLGQLQTSLQTNADALARAEQQKTYLTSLEQAVAQLGPGATPQLPTPPSQAEQDLRKAKTSLAVAKQQYTPEHPDVISLKAQVKALEAQVAAEKAATAKAAPPKSPAAASNASPLGPQGQSQIAVLNKEIEQRTKDQAAIQAKINQLQGRIDQLPDVEEQLTNLQNAYNVAKANDTVLLQKKAAAEMGAAMEQQAQGEEFRIMDPANLPQKPDSPNLLQIDGLGSAAGLMLGLGLAFLIEMRDAVVRSDLDVAYYTKMPLLAALPALPPAPAPVSAIPAPAGEAG